MAYAVYTTPALVCGSFDRNTSDKTVLLFTREAGMIYANVKSAREERSKHRYSLTEFTIANVSLVKGKGGWRIVGTEVIRNIYTPLTTREERACVRDIVRLLRRMIRGEEALPDVYDLIISLLSNPLRDPRRIQLELSHTILMHLGYVSAGVPTNMTDTELESAISTALHVSHL